MQKLTEYIQGKHKYIQSQFQSSSDILIYVSQPFKWNIHSVGLCPIRYVHIISNMNTSQLSQLQLHLPDLLVCIKDKFGNIF